MQRLAPALDAPGLVAGGRYADGRGPRSGRDARAQGRRQDDVVLQQADERLDPARGARRGDSDVGLVVGTALGSAHAKSFASDPKHLLFMLARYHFVARMLNGQARVLEIGCGDGSGAPLVAHAVGELCGIDADPKMAAQAAKVMPAWHHDILRGSFRAREGFTAAYALDVLEHIDEGKEDKFFSNINASLRADHAPVIIGSPSLESQPHA